MLNLARVCLDNRFGVPAFSRADLPKDMSELAPDLSIRVDIGSPVVDGGGVRQCLLSSS